MKERKWMHEQVFAFVCKVCNIRSCLCKNHTERDILYRIRKRTDFHTYYTFIVDLEGDIISYIVS